MIYPIRTLYKSFSASTQNCSPCCLPKEKIGYSFKKDDSARAIRIKSLGERYSYDQIQKRINENKKEDTIAVTDDNLLVYLDNILKDEMYLSGNGSDPAIRRKQIVDAYAFLKDRSIFSLSMLNKSQTDLAVAIKDKHARLHAMEDQIDELENICENLKKRDMYNDIYASYIIIKSHLHIKKPISLR